MKGDARPQSLGPLLGNRRLATLLLQLITFGGIVVLVARHGPERIPEYSYEAAVQYDTNVAKFPLEGSSPDLTQALECLRKTKPNLVLSEYPSDSFEHYSLIHQRLSTWTQLSNHAPHRAAGYFGPWIENYFISRFQPLINSKADLIRHFGPYIPIFVPWTDHWVKSKYTYPSALVDEMQGLLREDTLYIILVQNADGFVGRCSEFQALQELYHITILSAGGWLGTRHHSSIHHSSIPFVATSDWL